jgi:exodeoxyribonuclease V alpha subunit
VVLNFDGLLVNNDFGELDEISPVYAVTTHKSQGSEYPAVVIPLSTQHTTEGRGIEGSQSSRSRA